MKKEYSAGGVVFNDQGQIIICRPTNHQIWVFPKGRIENDEDPKTTAIREVEEEAGVVAEIIDLAGEMNFIFKHPKRGELDKTITMYVMKLLSGDVNVHDWEMEEVIWLSPEEALQKLSFEKDKQILESAIKIYAKHSR